MGECEYMYYKYSHIIYVHCILYMVHVLRRRKMEVHVHCIHMIVYTRQMQGLLASGVDLRGMRIYIVYVHVNSKLEIRKTLRQTNSVRLIYTLI